MKDIITAVTESIEQNEIGGDKKLIYCFSDPDGVRTGKSGWSFGRCQFDINNNSNATLCLKEIGFSIEDIHVLRAQTCDIRIMDARLRVSKLIVDRWDEWQVKGCISHIKQLAGAGDFEFADDIAFVCACDYHNQFFASKGGKFFTFCKGLGRPVTAKDILDFKLTLPWGQKRSDDVERRNDNIIKIMTGP